MPRGIITSSYGNSYYQVEVAQNNTARTAPLIAEINDKLDRLAQEKDYLSVEMDAAMQNIINARYNLQQIPLPIKTSQMAEATAEIARAKQYKDLIDRRLQRIDVLERGYLARRTELAGFGDTTLTILAHTVMVTTGEAYCYPVLPVGTQVDVAVWDDEVGGATIGYSILTIEVGKPGYSTGVYTPAPLLDTHWLHYNHTIQDGHRRWRPQYPIGVVTGVNIPAQRIDIEIERLEYRKSIEAHSLCLAIAVHIGDRMVIDVAHDRILGWAESPRVCTPSYITTQNETKSVVPGVSYLATGAPKDDPKYRYTYRVVYASSSSSSSMDNIFMNEDGDDCHIFPGGSGACVLGRVISSTGSSSLVVALDLAGYPIDDALTVHYEYNMSYPQAGSTSTHLKSDKYNFYLCKRTGMLWFTRREQLTEVIYFESARETRTTVKLWSVADGTETLSSTTVSTTYEDIVVASDIGDVRLPSSQSSEEHPTSLTVYAPRNFTYSLC